MSKKRNSLRPKVTILPGKGVAETINGLLRDRNQLNWLIAVGRNEDGDLFYYDSGGDILQDLGALEYMKQRILQAHLFEDEE